MGGLRLRGAWTRLAVSPLSAHGHLEAPLAQPAAAAPATARSRVTATRVVAAVAGVYGTVFAAAAVVRHLAFGSARYDVGNMTQAVWNTAHGRLLEASSDTGETFVRLGSHADPFLVLLAPLWWVWPSPLMLLVLQALAVATGALPVFWLARKHLGNERAAVHLALAYLVFPATQFNAFTPESGFHPASFAVPLLLFAVWFLDEDRLVPFLAFAVLAGTTKEQMPLVAGMLGLWYAVSRRRALPGVPVLLGGIAWSALNFLVVIPHFQQPGERPFAERYAELGGTPLHILRTAVTDPGTVVSTVATGHKLLFVGLLAVPLLGMWALSPALALGAVPELGIDLLSSDPNQTTVFFHYTAGIVPFLFAATVLGMRRFRGNASRMTLYVLAGCASTAILSPLLLSYGDLREALPANAKHRARAEALARIPGSAPVSASNKLGAHLGERRVLLTFPALARAEWAVVDRADPTYGDRGRYLRAIERLRRDPAWKLVSASDGVLVFRRA
jgi:uncharacterized membrane protein